MTKSVPFSLLVATLALTLAACKGGPGPLLGLLTERYVNQTNAGQTLELTTQQTLKGLIAGKSPEGIFTFADEQRVTMGGFTRKDDTFVLKFSSEHQELKIALQKDGSLRDEAGNTWRLQERSRSFRPPEKVLVQRRIATAN